MNTPQNGTSCLGPDPGSCLSLEVFALTPADFSPTTRMNIPLYMQHSGSETAQNLTDFSWSSKVGPRELMETCWFSLRWFGLQLTGLMPHCPPFEWNRYSNSKVYSVFIKFMYSNCKIRIHIQTFQKLSYFNIIMFQTHLSMNHFVADKKTQCMHKYEWIKPWYHRANAIKVFYAICNFFFF